VDLGGMAAVDRGSPSGRAPTVSREEAEAALGSVDDYTDEEIVRMRRSYYASVGFLDTCVGRILAALDRAGVGDATLILFTSDHGDMLGQRRLLGKGAHFYEACARVPLILREPGAPATGRRSDALVQVHDIAATVLRAAGMPSADLRQQMPSALPLQEGAGHSYAFAAYRNSCINRRKLFWDPPILCTMVRSTTHKLTLYHSGEIANAAEGELYDMEADPGETRNLWDSPAAAEGRRALTAEAASWVANETRAGPAERVEHVFPSTKSWLKNNPIRLQR
jgi:arylsulfatase A-like enzyme